ncbi:hypothetical protein [Dyella mobilis]|uniref:Uncharacterized protein n=1 Tax=Dyella mobilis TaxID=1849582 RepID=A0ABS2KDZ9_9GAMM|nr:hypothetical protein [Dyella mobilis]MBM7129399.1 hypothetical protein [Dyella mobilis]GLQ98336.1 hypothetical protein GCM10007863_27560 [Dyella mobilis]
MNAGANISIDIDDAEVRERTAALLDKAQAILDLIISGAASDGDFRTVTSAAWAIRDMIAEANRINGWF